jgi:hypothetical protein
MHDDESTVIECPYCGEQVEIVLEADLEGEMVWDCEVCCRPWQLSVRRRGDEFEISVRADDE